MATVQLSAAARNNIAEAYELSLSGQTLSAGAGAGAAVTGVAAPPRLLVYTGALPANCAATATGTKLVDMTVPADFMAPASGGSKALAGSWAVAAVAAGAPGYYRMVDAAGVCHEQGDISAAGGSGAMTVDSMSVGAGQTFAVLTKSITIPHA